MRNPPTGEAGEFRPQKACKKPQKPAEIAPETAPNGLF
jgi:hypothetical protein